MGARKGLGAQKVVADFTKIEEEAKRAVQLKDDIRNLRNSDEPVTEEQRAENLKTIKASIEQMGEQIDKKKELLRTLDKDKAEQFERLGMGAAAIINQKSSRISHSAASGVRGFEKVPSTSKGRNSNDIDSLLNSTSTNTRSFNKISMDDFFDVPKKESDFWSSFDDSLTIGSGQTSSSVKPQIIESIQLLEPKRQLITSGSGSSNKSIGSGNSGTANETRTIGTFNSDRCSSGERSASIRSSTTTKSTLDSDSDTQRKFAGAKSISSDQYFGRGDDQSYENKSNLSRFQGSDAISSDAYFNREIPKSRSGYSEAISSANLYDIKEGVKDGVSKVAGRLSSLATDVFSSLQDKYGNF